MTFGRMLIIIGLVVLVLGVIVSSLHGRAETRIFAKQVANGRSKHSLSDEEQQATLDMTA